jgi:Outer membrane protein beta-barrel domain
LVEKVLLFHRADGVLRRPVAHTSPRAGSPIGLPRHTVALGWRGVLKRQRIIPLRKRPASLWRRGLRRYKWNGRVALSGDARFLHFGGFENSTESSYLAGPKVYFLSNGRFQPYGKFLLGEGRIHYPFQIGDASYFALAPGIGSGYRINHHWMLRAEYEYQIWYGSPDYANEPKHQLTPNGIHVGVAYRIFR